MVSWESVTIILITKMSEGYTLHSGVSLPEPGILIRDRNLKNPQVAFWRPNGSLYNANDAAHSMAQSIRFNCLKISQTEVGINLEVNIFL